MRIPNHSGRGRSIAGSVAALTVIAIALFIPSMAQAAVPGNDEIAAATTIGSLPFSDSLDTSEATSAPDDPNCAGNGHSVWYTFTPSADIRLDANTFGSSYDTTISAYTGSPGALTQVACNDDAGSLQSQIVFDATAGQTVYIMAGSFGSQNGGSLTLALGEAPPPPPAQCADGLDNDLDGLSDLADPGCDGPLDNDETDPPPPPPQLSLSLSSSGSVDTSGVATIRGTVTCDHQAFVNLSGSLTQTFARRFTVQGFGGNSVSCTPPSVPWSLTVTAFNGNRFSAGNAAASISAFGCNNGGCGFDSKSADVRLRGGGGH